MMVITSMILAAALCGQTPSPRPTEAELAAQTAQLKAEIQARAAARAASLTDEQHAFHAAVADARRAKDRAKRERARVAWAASQTAQRKALARAEAQYRADAERMLPFQLEQQRLALENQRQMLQRQSEYERNAALSRIAGAAERNSGLYTQYNSGFPPVSPQIAPHMR